MKSGDKVRLINTEHTAKVVRVQGDLVVIVWDAGGYGRILKGKLEVIEGA